MKKSINIWLQLLGFNRDDEDKGASRFLAQTGFIPDSVCALLFHCDFVNLHRGMDAEYVLLQDNCSYYGIPRNKERERQNWTNYDLRTLVCELKKKGVGFYAGIMGVYVNNMHHHEWLTDHPELRSCQRNGAGGLMCLKRFKDGTYYEDFFAKRLVETLVDYGMEGVHLSDGFCPSSVIYMSDYSSDMVDQFLTHTQLVLSKEIMATMGDDSPDAASKRADYLWQNHREAWIRFYQWRWEKFFRTVCNAVHKVGKQVWIVGMYCTDPFETTYIHAFDCKRVMDAGVDCITANDLPTSVSMNRKKRPYYFHRMHMDIPLVSAQVGNHKILSMLNVQDASEEWNILEHRPVQLERDLYTIASYRTKQGNNYTDAAEGFFICLGDGIESYHWNFLKSRIDVGFDVDAYNVWSPMILWSETAHQNMLPAYIATRRTTVHKQSFEVFKAGTPMGGSVRSDDLNGFDGTLFVPNYDLLSEEEQARLTQLQIPFVGTVPADYDLSHLHVEYCCNDQYSDYPLKAFVCGAKLSNSEIQKIEVLCGTDDGRASTANDPELQLTALYGEIPFCKLTNGFVQSIGIMLRALMLEKFPVISSVPMMALQLKNGKDRLYLYNTEEDFYDHAIVTSKTDLKSVKVVSHYPVLPPRFIQEQNTSFAFDYNKAAEHTNKFQTKLAPAGVTIVDIER